MQDVLVTTIQADTDADEFETVDGWHERLNDLSADNSVGSSASLSNQTGRAARGPSMRGCVAPR